MGMNDILPGCETFEAYHRPKFYPGMKANLKDFEFVTCVTDETDVQSYSPREHPSFGVIKKGEKVKFKELSFNYLTLRVVDDKGRHMAVYDCVGNFIIQKIIKRFIVDRCDIFSIKMMERIYYIDRYGNKWAPINENNDLILIETRQEGFSIFSYVDKAIHVENDFTYEEYDHWRDSQEQKVQQLYYYNAMLM